MPRPLLRLATASVFVCSLSIGVALGAETPIQGILIGVDRATPERLAAWKAEGGTAVVVPLDESVPRGRWSSLAADSERAGLALYPWIEVARNPAMADAHPDWMASTGGHHADWRRRFPGAPVAKPGEVVKAWPWVPIGFAPAFDAHRARLKTLLDGLPGAWAGVFVNDLQTSPSSCGCGNDQCRWALDYGSPPTAAKTPGDDPAARIVAELVARHPGKAVIPVWVTECETIDQPRVAGSTGLCGGVECAKNDCWPRYARAWNPLLKAAPGAVAVGLWSEAFAREPSWSETGLSLFLQPPRGGSPVAPDRAIAILQGWGKPEPDRARLTASAKRAGGGWVVAIDKVDQSWEPRLVKTGP